VIPALTTIGSIHAALAATNLRYLLVMAGHSRSKSGVASLAYVPAIHVLLA